MQKKTEQVKTQKIGDFFKEYRLLSGLSLTDIARELSLESEELIYEYEQGQRRIPLSRIYGFANIYDIPADQVLELFYKISEYPEEVDTKLHSKKTS